MSRYLVVINFEVDPDDFIGVSDTISAVEHLTFAMIAGQADFPELTADEPNRLRIQVTDMGVGS